MDASAAGLLWTLGVDLAVFLVCYIFFVRFIRKEHDPKVLVPPLPELEEGTVSRILNFLYSPPRLQVREVEGVVSRPLQNTDAALYLRHQQMNMVLFAIMTLLGMSVLLPVYLTGGSKPKDPKAVSSKTLLEHVSTKNLALGSPYLWGSFVLAVVFSLLTYAMVSIFMREIRIFSRGVQRRAHTATRTVHLEGLDPRCTSNAALIEYFEERFPGAVESVHIVPNLSKLDSLAERRKALDEQIERVRAQEEATGHSVEVFEWQSLGQVRLLPSLLAQRRSLEAEFQEEKNAPHVSSSHAFVRFVEPPKVGELFPSVFERGEDRVQRTQPLPSFTERLDVLMERREQGINEFDWVFRLAPDPSDIVWHNMSVSSLSRTLRTLTINVLLFVTLVFVCGPVTVLNHLGPLFSVVEDSLFEDRSSKMRVMMSNYLPALTLFLINSIVLPWLIDLSSYFERHRLESTRMRSVLHKNCFFMFFNTLLLPTLALNSVAAFLHFSRKVKWEDWDDIIGNIFFSSSGHFFIQYMIHATILGAAGQLLDLPQWLWRKWSLRSAITDSEKQAAEQIWPFDYGYWYSVRLTIFGMVLVYSVVVPVLALCGFLYFLVQHAVDRYNLEHDVYGLYFSSSGHVPATVSRYMLVYVALFQFAMSGFFFIQHEAHFQTAGVVCVIATLLTTAIYFTHLFRFKPAPHADTQKEDRQSVSREEREQSFLQYHHPLLRTEEPVQ